jgi:hypothetical protein
MDRAAAKQRKCSVTSQEIETTQTGISVVIETSDALIRQENGDVVEISLTRIYLQLRLILRLNKQHLFCISRYFSF